MIYFKVKAKWDKIMASYAQKLVVLRDVEKLKETSLNCLNI